MRVYGLLNNRMMESSKQPEPVVGMGATECMYSDRHACTIVEVISPKKIVVQRDKAIRTDKNEFQTESQHYRYEPNPEGRKVVISKRKNGKWVEKGRDMDAAGYLLGHRDEYRDPHM